MFSLQWGSFHVWTYREHQDSASRFNKKVLRLAFKAPVLEMLPLSQVFSAQRFFNLALELCWDSYPIPYVPEAVRTHFTWPFSNISFFPLELLFFIYAFNTDICKLILFSMAVLYFGLFKKELPAHSSWLNHFLGPASTFISSTCTHY